ncbi:hypothetical protein CesoFtcFv8_024766 [Champsocephalus esox]|uniref:Uncharacterized protein n=2 Tax=Champsocephalus TaxID=52236 RepID=A0AAN8C6S9_CHAGU|nr:hypothetical protein CesoFtcFv8_024766 [Champsocephalus esox]KAK5898210.1 hypothetical protein CgunFtcFv8_015647 [Champsocephalus gunnari]
MFLSSSAPWRGQGSPLGVLDLPLCKLMPRLHYVVLRRGGGRGTEAAPKAYCGTDRASCLETLSDVT